MRAQAPHATTSSTCSSGVPWPPSSRALKQTHPSKSKRHYCRATDHAHKVHVLGAIHCCTMPAIRLLTTTRSCGGFSSTCSRAILTLLHSFWACRARTNKLHTISVSTIAKHTHAQQRHSRIEKTKKSKHHQQIVGGKLQQEPNVLCCVQNS